MKRRLITGVFVLIGVSLLAGLTDFLVTRSRGFPILSVRVDVLFDGGTGDYSGFGYSLRAHHRRMGPAADILGGSRFPSRPPG